jgi:hypothetical protein
MKKSPKLSGKSWEFEDIPSIRESDLLHDVNFNNKKKIKLEHTIAKVMVELPSPNLLAIVSLMSKVTLPFIQYIKDHDNAVAHEIFDVFLRHVGAHTDQFARDDSLGEDCQFITKEEAQKTLLPWLEKMLTETKPSSQALLSIVRIHLAADYVLFDLLKKQESDPRLRLARYEAILCIVPDADSREKIDNERFTNNGVNSINAEAYQKRGRISRNKQQPLTQQFGLFATSSEDEVLPLHRRGMDLFRVRANYLSRQSYSHYVAKAIDGDMPLVCSISTTALRLLRYAAVLTPMSVMDYWHYALAHLSYNIQGGHHTFHEYAAIMALVGVPYQAGNYSGIFPQDNPAAQFLRQINLQGFIRDAVAEEPCKGLASTALSNAMLEINQHYEDVSDAQFSESFTF